jgi:5-hydroxyisourate hydrolase
MWRPMWLPISRLIWRLIAAPTTVQIHVDFGTRITFMGHLSTHVLDTAHGCPAAGMRLNLQRLEPGGAVTLKTLTLNADGRTDDPLLVATTMATGRYRLQFWVADYFRAKAVLLPDPPFLDVVTLDFGIADVAGHYHVPLLVSPWSHSSYRGS